MGNTIPMKIFEFELRGTNLVREGFTPNLKMTRERFKSVENGSKTMKNHPKMEPLP
jgi:hypothetical protein